MSRLHDYLENQPKDQLSPAAVAYAASLDEIEAAAPSIAQAIEKELHDQRSYLKLIASENYSSYPVQLAMGNWLTDKYAEGVAHHRFYAGCENVDAVEEEAQNLLKELFNAEYAYVQPHSGADANLVAFWAILVKKIQNPQLEKLGKKTIDELTPDEYEQIRKLFSQQKLLGLSLNSGGHLTHGYRHNASGKMFQAVYYDVDPKTELIDYEALAALAKKEKPTILLAGYSAHPRRLNFAKMRQIADSVGAILMVDMAHFAGLVAGKAFTGEFNPIPYADLVTSTTHKTLRGPRGGFILAKEEWAETLNKGCPLVLGGPLPHVLAAKAIAFREALQPSFQDYSRKVVQNAQALAKRFVDRGVRIVSGGTENHMVIVDLAQFGLTGRHAETALREAHFTLNRNAVPFDPNGPWYTSGIRIGTPAVTTLGMGEKEMAQIAEMIIAILEHTHAVHGKNGQLSRALCETEGAILERVRADVQQLLHRFPLYPELPNFHNQAKVTY